MISCNENNNEHYSRTDIIKSELHPAYEAGYGDNYCRNCSCGKSDYCPLIDDEGHYLVDDEGNTLVYKCEYTYLTADNGDFLTADNGDFLIA